jgi:thioesterase domain-containing protein
MSDRQIHLFAPITGQGFCYQNLHQELKNVGELKYWEWTLAPGAPGFSRTIPGLASEIADGIKGPAPVLIGYSFGGWVALEVARRLSAANPYVILMDSLCWERRVSGAAIRQMALEIFWTNFTAQPPPKEYGELATALGVPLWTIAARVTEILGKKFRLEEVLVILRTIEANLLARSTYVPARYTEEGMYVSARGGTNDGAGGRSYERVELERLFPSFSFAEIGGSHRAMMNAEGSRELWTVLSQKLTDRPVPLHPAA